MLRISTTPDHTGANKASDLIILEVEVTLRQSRLEFVAGMRKRRLKTAGLICFRQDDNSWRCNEHTCNGRPIELRPDLLGGLVLDIHKRLEGATRPGGLMLKRSCESTGGKFASRLDLGSYDQVFQLKRAPPEKCR